MEGWQWMTLCNEGQYSQWDSNLRPRDSKSEAQTTLATLTFPNCPLGKHSSLLFVCLCWGFMAQSTQQDHAEHGQYT